MSDANDENVDLACGSETNLSSENGGIVIAPGVCSCAGHPPLQIKHCFSVLAILVLRTLVLVFALAYLLSLIDWLRTMGSAPLLLPFSALGQYQVRLESAAPVSPLVDGFDNFILLYNLAFPGASRLGCGIGIIAAAFWTLHTTQPSCRIQRIAIGITAGALVGFRLMLMLTSSAVSILSATVLCCLGMSIYMLSADRKPGIPSLPLASSDPS